MQLPPALKNPQALAPLGITIVTTFALVLSAVLGGFAPTAPEAEPQGEKSVIQVVTASGKSAGRCAIGGLREEKVHYTDKDSLYYWELKPGEERITASCPSASALSSGKTHLEGEATVTRFDAPQVVTITVR